MGILQLGIPVRRMASERKTHLTDALVRILCRFLTPASVELPGEHDQYTWDSLLALAGHGDGHVLTVAVSMLLAVLTGRSDLCIAGVFGAGKTRSLAVLLIALSCELKDFSAVIYTKENVAGKVSLFPNAISFRTPAWTHRRRQAFTPSFFRGVGLNHQPVICFIFNLTFCALPGAANETTQIHGNESREAQPAQPWTICCNRTSWNVLKFAFHLMWPVNIAS